jgi:fructan beta-fructosidase
VDEQLGIYARRAHQPMAHRHDGPRSLTLRRTSAGWRLAQTPVEELRILREEPALEFSGGSFAAADLWLYQRSDLNELLDVEMTFSEVFPSAPFVINIHTGIAEVTAIAIDPSEGKLTIDRTHSGIKEFYPAFAASSRHAAPLRIANGILKIRFLLDTSSLEVFLQDGEIALTDLIFPSAGNRSIGLSSEGGNALSLPKVERITIHKLRSAVIDH